MPVLATIVVGGLLVLAAYAGTAALAAAVVALAAVLAYGLLGGVSVPERVPAGALVVLTGAGAVLAVLASDVVAGAEASFAAVLQAFGPAMVVALLVVLARPAARARAIDWLAVTTTGVLVAVLAGAIVALGRQPGVGVELVAIAAAGAVVGSPAAVVLARRAGDGRERDDARRDAHRAGWLDWAWWLGRLGWLALVALALAAAYVIPLGGVELTDRLVLGVAALLAAGVASTAVAARPPGTWLRDSALVASLALALAAPVAATTARVLLA